jgi:hypothetical protein
MRETRGSVYKRGERRDKERSGGGEASGHERVLLITY